MWVWNNWTVNDNDNDNDKRLGFTAKADQPDHKKIQYTKNKNVKWKPRVHVCAGSVADVMCI